MQNTFLILSLIIGLSGWGKITYDWFTSDPKIVGRVLGVITVDIRAPNHSFEPKTTIMVYLYLINKRKNPVHILDYQLEYDTGSGYQKALRVYGFKEDFQPNFTDQNLEISFPDFGKKLIYNKHLPIEYGTPLHGFALFSTGKKEVDLLNKIKKMKITCIDAFNKKHVIIHSEEMVENIYLLQDIAGIEIKQKTVTN